MSYREGEAIVESTRDILVVGLAGKVIGLDRRGGEIRWTRVLQSLGGVFVALRHGLLVVSGNASSVHRLDYLSGEVVWSKPTTANGRATILIETDVVIVAKGGYLDAFAHDGAPLWKQELKGMGIDAATLALPGNIAQADTAGL
jgi:outer membrane protein assembly factor BamB